jgi:potassium-transporting ATPase potassium-binding subunit
VVAVDWLQIVFYAAFFILITPLLGGYIAKVFSGKATFIQPYLKWLENLLYKLGGIDPNVEMTWIKYTKVWMIFNFLGFLFLFFIQVIQNYLPLNPQNFPNVPWPLAFNTAMSFATNSDWQSYAGEATLSYFTQMVGLSVQNFLSAATGLAPLLVLIRGIARKQSDTIGNFWSDLVRSIVYIFLPLSILFALFLIGQGVVQTFSPYVEVKTMENFSQIIPLGPAASQVAIKQLGTNGGGFFNANSAHPFENPTPLTNFLEMLALILIPAALVYSYGKMIGYKKHAWLLFMVMFTLWIGGLFIALYFQYQHNPSLNSFPMLEGIETRFGITNSLIWSVTTTATSNGSVNAMVSSLFPMVGGICLFNMMIGELIFGGVGVGMCSLLMLVILTVFLSGLMVGRTPEYLGKKIEKHEIHWVVLSVMYQGVLILIGAGISCTLPFVLASLGNQGPHGLTEVLYAFTSAAANNGSSFAGLNANTSYFNIVLGVIMLLGRLAIVVPSFAVGGLLAKKKISPVTLGTFSTESCLFFILLISVILLVSALTFFIALILGPIIEQFLMFKGLTF